MPDIAGSSATSSGGPRIKLKIKTMEPATYDLEVPRSITIASLKSDHIVSLANAPAERQRIIFRGRALRDEQTLETAGKENPATAGQMIVVQNLDIITDVVLFSPCRC